MTPSRPARRSRTRCMRSESAWVYGRGGPSAAEGPQSGAFSLPAAREHRRSKPQARGPARSGDGTWEGSIIPQESTRPLRAGKKEEITRANVDWLKTKGPAGAGFTPAGLVKFRSAQPLGFRITLTPKVNDVLCSP